MMPPGLAGAPRPGRLADGTAALEVSVSRPAWPGGPCTVVTLAGEADMSCRIVEDVLQAEAAKAPALLVVDMPALAFLDSWALQQVLRAARSQRQAGGMLAVSGPRGPVQRVMTLTGASQTVPVFATVAEALAGAARPARGRPGQPGPAGG